ncbi:MAG: YiiX/YebB-like N1pC/P60 family cysteine hydrolase [Candidatus Eremiobacterota bacterium]
MQINSSLNNSKVLINQPSSRENQKTNQQSDQVVLGSHVDDSALLMGDKLKEMKSGGAAGTIAVGILDIRVPTTTKDISEEERNKILSVIQPGDVILETSDSHPNWQRLEVVTLGSTYTHAAIYEGDGKFLEATTGDPSGKGVIRTDLKEYLEGPIHVKIIRPPYKGAEDVKSALDYARSQLDKPYDSAFNYEDDSQMYCAELVKKAIDQCPSGIETPMAHTIFTKLTGKKAVGPDNFGEIEGAKVVYPEDPSKEATFLKGTLSHWPVAAGAAAGAVAGAATIGGPIGTAAGLLGGLALSICIGNKIQTGHFNLYGVNMSDYK